MFINYCYVPVRWQLFHSSQLDIFVTVHGNIWQGKFWRTIQVKAIGEENCGEKATVSAYAKYVFRVFVNIDKKNFGQ